MKIESIRIENCNRFTLGERKVIIVKPVSKIQMILGTNGSGKSSFMELCFSPLAPSPNDFDANGFWEYVCVHEGKHYVLSADYEKRKFSFIVDGEELNQSHLTTVQDVLVEQHFGYTRFIHSVLTQRVKFTEMTAAARSDAISKISNEDFSYAYSKFKEWTKLHSSNLAVKKFLTGRLGEETAKLLSPEDKERMSGNVLRIKADLREYLSLDRPVVNSRVLEDDIHRSIQRFSKACDDMLSRELPNLRGMDLDKFRSMIAVLTDRLDTKIDSLKQVQIDLSRLENQKEHIRQLTNIDPEVVRKEILDLETALAQIPDKNIDVPDEWLVPADEVIAMMNNRLSVLSHDFNEAEYRDLTAKFNEEINKLNKAHHTLESIESRILELTATCEVTCPSCSFKFRPGVNESDLDGLQHRLIHGRQYIVDLDASKDILESNLSILDASKGAIEDVYKVREQYYNQARGLFHYIDSVGGLKKGKSLISDIAIYSKEVGFRHRRGLIESRLNTARMALESHVGKSADFAKVINEYTRLDQLYNDESKIIQQMRDEITGESGQLNYMAGYEVMYNNIMDIYKTLHTQVIEYLTQSYLTMLDEDVSKLQSTLAINESVLSNNDQVETYVKDLQNQLRKVDLDVSAYKTLADTMSPRSGLIADRIRSQATAQVTGINQIIEKIWNYDFKMTVPDDTAGLLDYKFPMTVEGVTRDDVRQGSGSMRHIVDTAFAMLAHYSLNLVGFPIFLDEFDSTFDGVHSENMVGLVRDLGDTDRFNHVVVISHNETIQNAFPNAEILVLDDRNLDMSAGINTHATFK